MIVKKTPIADALLIELERREDHRGFFARAWCEKEAEKYGLHTGWVQANIAGTTRRGTIRGMHYQVSPHEEIKLIRCVKGEIYDAFIDIRPNSPTFKKWWGIRLNADKYQMVYVPKGFAHGYQALTDYVEVFYQVSQFYTPEAERGVRWDDPAFEIDWPIKESLIVSEKDRNWPLFQEAKSPHAGDQAISPNTKTSG